jgi:hypothetical protein
MKRTASMSSLGSTSSLDIDPSIKGTTLEEIAEGQCAAMDLQWPMVFSTPSHFLHHCFLCKRRLMLERDIYMYK